MDFTLSKEHLMLQEMFKSFAEKEVKPRAHDMDEAETFSPELLKKMVASGLMGIPFPAELGGANSDVLGYALAIEELSKCDASTGITLSVHTSLATTPIYEFGNDDQKARYMKKLASGQWIGAFGLTEPNAGTDAAGQQSKAEKKGDKYVINGSKIFITNSAFADVFVIFVMTNKELGTKAGISAFIVEKGTKGLTITKDIKRMGIRAASNCELAFEDLEVPVENMLGKEGEGFKIAMKTLDGGRIGVAAQSLGIAQGAIDETIKYVKERQQFGKRISQFQNTQFQLADMQTKVDAARLLVYRSAVAKSKKEPFGHLAAMAKLFASETANDVARRCVQLYGGYGFSREYPVERMMRDAKITEIYEGTSEVQKMVISGWMGVN